MGGADVYARDGDRLLLHGSTGAGALRQVAAGAEAVVAVTAIDALVLATSLFEHSANYRSAVVRGSLVPLVGDEAVAALDRLSDALVPGRRGELRGHLKKEVAATVALALDITDDNWLLKVSDGDVDEELDVSPTTCGPASSRSSGPTASRSARPGCPTTWRRRRRSRPCAHGDQRRGTNR